MSQHHRNLGVRVGATKAEIKKAYRKVAMRLHPDKNPDPRAADLFAQLQDSYDALMNPLAEASRPTPQAKRTQQKTQSHEERKREARKRYQEHMRKQSLSDERYFQSLTTGIRGLYFKIGMILCGIVLLATILDSFLPKHQIPDEFYTFSSQKRENGQVASKVSVGTKNNEQFTLKYAEYFTLSTYPDLLVEKTRLLHLPYQVIHPVQGQLNKYKIQNSIWNSLPAPLLFFLIPAILIFYKKRTSAFTAMYMACSYVIFPVTIFFLIDHARWLHILSLGFF